MIYEERIQDLFTVEEDYYLAHCISADFAMGKGIVLEFNKRFDMKNKLKKIYPNYSFNKNVQYDCILVGRVFNLITKEKYFHKPTYNSMRGALEVMKQICIKKEVHKIAMPLIGCGLDRLKWENVSTIIQEVFKDTHIEIVVCKQQ